MIKVLICANSTVELDRLEALVTSARSLKLVGSSLGRANLRQQLADAQPDVLLEHSRVVDLDELRSEDLDAKTVARVLLVTEPEFAAALESIQAFDSGLRGVLPASASEREIRIAVEAAAGGLLILHPDVVEQAASSSLSFHSSNVVFGQQLSPRESEILNLLATGLGNKEIAWQLKISEHTVKFHVTSIFNKLNVSSRAEAVTVGVRRGLIIL
jgi:two-component system, NarL family, response regulator YdfI